MVFLDEKMRRSRSYAVNAAVMVLAFYVVLTHTPLRRNKSEVSDVSDILRSTGDNGSDEGGSQKEVQAVDKKKVVLPDVVTTEVKIISRPIVYTRPKNPEKARDVWHVIKAEDPSENDYILSAFLDDRITVEQRSVRVIGVFDESQKNHHCLLWNEGNEQPILVAAQYTRSAFLQWDADKKFEGEIISCGVPKDTHPSHVSIITGPGVQPSNLIEIQTLSNDEKQLPFGVCVTQVYNNHTMDLLKFIEWMEALKILGVKEVTLYNDTLPNDMEFMIKSYVDSKFLVLRPAPNVFETDGPEALMNGFPVVNDCIYRNMYRYAKVIIADLDELILPKVTENYKDLIEEINLRALSSDHPFPVYFFKTSYYFKDLPSKADPKYSVILRFLYRGALKDSYVFGSTILYPESVIALLHPFQIVLAHKYRTPFGWNVSVPVDLALNQRYEKCELDELNFQEDQCLKAKEVIYHDPPPESFRDNIDAAISAVFFSHDMEGDMFYGVGNWDDYSKINDTKELLKDPEMAAIIQQQQAAGAFKDNLDIAQQINGPAPKNWPAGVQENEKKNNQEETNIKLPVKDSKAVVQ